MANIKRVDCALLPPSRKTLKKKLQRAHFVTMIFSHADKVSPTQDRSPNDYGWITNGELLQPAWFDGPAVPENLFTNPEDEHDIEFDSSGDETIIQDHESHEDHDESGSDSEFSDSDLSDNEQWSEDSDSGSDLDDDF